MNNGTTILLAFFGLVAVAVAIRIFAGNLDRNRIRVYFEERGGRLISSSWAPFGTGWFGERSDRIYDVRYADKDGNEHDATCKTSLFTGVYLTEDYVVTRVKPPAIPESDSHPTDLESENRKLREELEQLKKRAV